MQQDGHTIGIRVRRATILAHGISQLPDNIDPAYSHARCIRPATWRASISMTKISSRWSSLRNHHILIYTEPFPFSPNAYNKVGETKSLLESTALIAENRSRLKRDFTT